MNPCQRQAEQKLEISRKQGTRQDYFGDKLRKKSKSSTRIILNNPNGLTGIKRKEKISLLQDKCLKYEIDILCLVEEGQNLRLTPEAEKLKKHYCWLVGK